MTAPCQNDDSKNQALEEVGKLRECLSKMPDLKSETAKTVDTYWFFVKERGMDPIEAREFVLGELEKSIKDYQARIAREQQDARWRRLERS